MTNKALLREKGDSKNWNFEIYFTLLYDFEIHFTKRNRT